MPEPKPKKKLSPTQQQAFDAIKAFIKAHGYSPSIEEISEKIGKSWSTTLYYFRWLERNGYIKSAEGKARTVSIVRQKEASL